MTSSKLILKMNLNNSIFVRLRCFRIVQKSNPTKKILFCSFVKLIIMVFLICNMFIVGKPNEVQNFKIFLVDNKKNHFTYFNKIIKKRHFLFLTQIMFCFLNLKIDNLIFLQPFQHQLCCDLCIQFFYIFTHYF